MSSTQLYKFTKEGEAECFGEVRNSFRGAMTVWNILDERYLPPFTPSWAIGDEPGKTYHRSSDMFGGGLKEVWALANGEDITKIDKIVLASTFDNVTVKKENIPELIEAFRAFEGECTIKEQADLIEEELKNNPDLIAIAWNQTSVNCDTWDSDVMGKDEYGDDYYPPYNILTEEKHWSMFDEL